MYRNQVFYRFNAEQGMSVEVNERLAGNFSVILTDTDANEIVGIMFFRNQETAISAAKGMVDPA